MSVHQETVDAVTIAIIHTDRTTVRVEMDINWKMIVTVVYVSEEGYRIHFFKQFIC